MSFRICHGLLVSELSLARYQPLKMQGVVLLTKHLLLYFYSCYLTEGNSKAYQSYHFLKSLSTIFQVHLIILLQL